MAVPRSLCISGGDTKYRLCRPCTDQLRQIQRQRLQPSHSRRTVTIAVQKLRQIGNVRLVNAWTPQTYCRRAASQDLLAAQINSLQNGITPKRKSLQIYMHSEAQSLGKVCLVILCAVLAGRHERRGVAVHW